jgi:hypothetical protein
VEIKKVPELVEGTFSSKAKSLSPYLIFSGLILLNLIAFVMNLGSGL